MKKIVTIFAGLVLSAGLVFAQQDARQRTIDTIVADALAQLPARDAEARVEPLADLAKWAPASVPQTAKLLPQSLAEYALDGLVTYVSDKSDRKAAVAEGLRRAIAEAPASNKQFLLACLSRIAGPADIDCLSACAADPALASTAIGTLVAIPEADDAIMALIGKGEADHSLLASAAAKRGLRQAEPVLLSWNAEPGVLEALGVIGSEASASVLKAQSPVDYARLLQTLAADGKTAVALKGAKELVKSDNAAIRTAATNLLLGAQPSKKALPLVDKIVADPDRSYRVACLSEAGKVLGAEAVASRASKRFKKLSPEAAGDVLYWAGCNGVMGETVRAEALAGSEDAIEAAGRLGQTDVLLGLAAEGNKAAYKALERIPGDIRPELLKYAEANPGNENLLALAGSRRLTDLAPQAIEMVKSDDASVKAAGLRVLPALCDAKVAAPVAALLDDAAGSDVAALQQAYSNAIRNLDGAGQYAEAATRIRTAVNPERFYPALAQSGSADAVAKLAANAARPEARQALMAIDNPSAAPELLRLSKTAPEKNALLSRYVELVSTYESDLDKRRVDIANALSRSDDAGFRSKALGAVAKIPTMKAFLLAGKYLDSNAAYPAAAAVRTIAAKTNEEIDYARYKEYLEKAKAIYAARGGADDGYSIDQINGLLADAEPSPIFVLPADEAAQGFEILFDGTNLDKWQGDKEGYTPVNGAIYVSAGYGATGNLYTIKEYRNFVFRFEFCFVREGINNGVGIRTPMGVDAAFDAMCECQILDHDAPMYAGLHDYQVHGSAYGIVPAKRLVHKPLGEWSTEEIRVEGDRIRCIVNGEVILDADLRKACKGHAVAPDGSNHNPYMIDGRNHPGLFRERGYISFCGHGDGLKLRNIRVLDLEKKKKK